MTKFEITWLEDTSDEGLLNELRRVAALMRDRCLTMEVFNSQSRISAWTVAERFGSWSGAKRKAGLTDARPVYSDAAILDDLGRVSDSAQGDPFTQKCYLSHGGRYSIVLVQRRFGGWREALEAAGIAGRFAGRPTTDRMRSQPGRTISNEDILAKIRNVAAQLGKASLTGAEIAVNSEINQRLLKSRFGGVSKALRLAGIAQVPHGRRYTEEEVFENLLGVWTHYGRPPKSLEMDQPPSTVGKNAYIKRFGGWRNALRAFVERANSDVASLPEPGPENHLAKETTRPEPTESAPTSALDANRPLTGSRIVERPRAPRPVRTEPEPADRRDPSLGLRFKVFQRDRFRCQLCGRSPATELDCILHADHIVPFSKGGKTTFENLRALCARCNLGRSNRSIA